MNNLNNTEQTVPGQYKLGPTLTDLQNQATQSAEQENTGQGPSKEKSPLSSLFSMASLAALA